MILKSEGDKIKFVKSPLRDRRYVIKAYTDLICQYPSEFLDDSIKTVNSCLIQLASDQNAGFAMGSTIVASSEDMLMDGAIDQTYAFSRQSHI